MRKDQLTPGNLAEFAGGQIGLTMLNAFLHASCQAERAKILRETLAELCEECGNRERAIGGFTVQIVNVLEQGLGVKP